MSAGQEGLRAFYVSAFRHYLLEPSETTLRAAYELGRDAVNRHLSVLDLAVLHHEALLDALRECSDAGEAQRAARAARDFFLESLSSFEMVQRGFREAGEAVLLERRQAEMLRQLSSFLADASLALDASDSLEEMLRLVAEQARELVGADCCVASLAREGQPRVLEAASYSEADAGWAALARWVDPADVYPVIRSRGGSARMRREELARHPPFRDLALNRDRPLRGWLAAPLTALDGRELGLMQLFDKHEGEFTEVDAAVLVHLAQMASAAVERAALYQRGG
jgi:GAF domain-containing protein/phosphoserine phosphatase RsbU-like protein